MAGSTSKVSLSQHLSDQMRPMIGAMAGFAIGAVLAGQRFSVWALVPVSLLLAICIAIGCFVDQTIASPLQRFVIISCTSQVGFLVGAILLALIDKRAGAGLGAHQHRLEINRASAAINRQVRSEGEIKKVRSRR
jgi:hypothetical protein